MVKITKTNRIYYLDFMRGFAIFFMIMQHAMIIHEKTAGEGPTILGNAFILLGTAPAAPVFLLILGIFLMKSQRTMKENIFRGLKLFGFGYILNLLRFCLPILIAGEPYMVEGNPISLLLSVDIFQLAGLSMIILAFIKNFANNKWIFPISIVLILIISPYLWGRFENAFIFDLLWGVNSNVAFPLFPWIIYPLLGMYLSPHLLRSKFDNRIRKYLLLWSIILGSIGLMTLDVLYIGDYSRSGLGIHFLIISFIFLWLLVSKFITNKISLDNISIVFKTLFYWSENVTSIYIIQWILYGWSMLLIGANAQNDYVAVIIGFGVLLLTHLLSKCSFIQRCIPRL